MGLNKEQREAVNHIHGPMLVLAGPGSGKTHTLVERILHLIDKGVPPNQILTITFSKKAAEEMQTRFQKQIGDNYFPVTFGTFHAIFFHILKDYYNYTKDSILTEREKREYVNLACKKLNMEINDRQDYYETFINKLGMLKSTLSDEDETLSKIFPDENKRKEFKMLASSYETLTCNARKIDFDDMLIKCHNLFRDNKSVLSRWQNVYKYFLVDEFQDINEVQYAVLKMLAGKERNIFAVGDDDQSIYGFRGSRPEIMKQFIEESPGVQIVNLSKNYRCSESVILNAGKLMGNNKTRIEKFQVAERKDKEAGFVDIRCFLDEVEEAEFVVNEVKKNINDSGYVKSTAILYRTSRCADLIEEKLRMSGVPIARNCENTNYYEREFIKDVVVYLRLALNVKKKSNLNACRQLFYPILNKPQRNLSRECILPEYFNKDVDDQDDEYKRLINHLEFIKDMIPYAAVTYILKGIGYERYVKEQCIIKYGDIEKANDICVGIQERSREFLSIEEWIIYIDACALSNIDRIDTAHNKQINGGEKHKKPRGKVVMQTVHASKGLEYDTVFVVGLMEGLFPHNKAISEEEIEEERRLLYVAMTRARYNLYILGRGDNEHGKHVSRFIYELNNK